MTCVEPGLLEIAVFLKQDLPGVPALLEAVALPVHLQDVDTVGEAVEESSREPLGPKDFGPLVEGQVGRHEDRATLIPLAEHLKEQLSTGL